MSIPLNVVSNKVEAAMLILPTCRGIEIISSNNIIRIEASSNYSKLVFTNGKTLIVAKVLNWFEKQPGMDMFLRTHRTHLVNRIFISRYINGKGGQICLQNGELIDVSKRKKRLFLYSWQAA